MNRFGWFFSGCLRTGIGNGAHHLFPYLCRCIRQENSVTLTLTHLPGSVQPGDLYQFLPEIICIRFGKIFDTVHCIETPCKSPCHFKMLGLILSDRNFIGFMYNYICRHKHRICEQSRINVIGLLSNLFLE